MEPPCQPNDCGPNVFPSGSLNIVNGGSYFVVGGNATSNVTHNHYHYPSTDAPSDLRKETLLKKLPENDFKAFHQGIRERLTPGTGVLFNTNQIFANWTKSKCGRLWFMGGPGVGKTYLTSAALESLKRLVEKAPGVAVIFGYLRHSNPMTTWDVVMALIRQLVERTNSSKVVEFVDKFFESHSRQNTRPVLTELVDLLRDLLTEFKDVFCSLDGLDEMRPEQQVELLDIVLSLNIKLLIMSRPLGMLKARLDRQKLENRPIFIEVIANPEDLKLFINHEIEKSPALASLLHEKGIKTKVVSVVLDKADGMFLHAALHVEALRSCITVQQVLDEIERFPRGLEGLYADTLLRINNEPVAHSHLAKQALVWLLNIKGGTLTISDLQCALSASLENQTFNPQDHVSKDFLLSICHGLIVVSSTGIVRLVHYTTYEMLPDMLLDQCPFPHEMITQVCMARLVSCSFQRFPLSSARASSFGYWFPFHTTPLIRYSHQNLTYHIHQAISSNAAFSAVAEQFVRNCTSYPYLHIVDYDIAQLHLLAPIHLATLLDMPDLVRTLIQEGVDINTKTWGLEINHGWTSLVLAASEGLDQVVETLIQLPGIDLEAVVHRKRTALMMAAVYGRETTLRVLLKQPAMAAGVNLKDVEGSSPLIIASQVGHVEAVKILLQAHGVDVNLKDREGWTALMHAGRYGNEGVARILLNADGININQQSDEGWTAMHAAAYYGSLDVVKVLLRDPGLDINQTDNRGWSALMNAAVNDHHTIVDALLKVPGIRVNIQDSDLWSALVTASHVGNHRVVDLLAADARVDVNLADHMGQTALIKAVQRERPTVVDILLKRPDIDINAVDKFGESALMDNKEEFLPWILPRLVAMPNLDVNIANKHGRTVLMKAVRYGDLATVKALLTIPGINVNAVDNEGRSALMIAAERNLTEVVRALLRTPGIDVNLKDKRGMSASAVAFDMGYKTMGNRIANYKENSIANHGRRLVKGLAERFG